MRFFCPECRKELNYSRKNLKFCYVCSADITWCMADLIDPDQEKRDVEPVCSVVSEEGVQQQKRVLSVCLLPNSIELCPEMGQPEVVGIDVPTTTSSCSSAGPSPEPVPIAFSMYTGGIDVHPVLPEEKKGPETPAREYEVVGDSEGTEEGDESNTESTVVHLSASCDKPLDLEKAKKVIRSLEFSGHRVTGTQRTRIPTAKLGDYEPQRAKKAKVAPNPGTRTVPEPVEAKNIRSFPQVMLSRRRREEVQYLTWRELQGPGDEWRLRIEEVVGKLHEHHDPDILFEATLVLIIREIRKQKPLGYTHLFWTSTTNQRRLGTNVFAQAHSMACPAVASGIEGFEAHFLEPNEVAGLTTYSCCTRLWVKGLTVDTFLSSWYGKSAGYLVDFQTSGPISTCVDRMLAAVDLGELQTVKTVGHHKLDLSRFLTDDLEQWVLDTLFKYGQMSRSGTGVPDFRAISDRKMAFRIDDSDSDKYAFPLQASGRLQLYLSINHIQTTLPGLHEYLMGIMGARTLVYSLLYSEGINHLRFDENFLADRRIRLDNMYYTYDNIAKYLRPGKVEYYRDIVRQSAHKDTVKGAFSNVTAYTPTQLVCALYQPASLSVWLKGNQACLQHWDTGEDWVRGEIEKGYERKEIKLNPKEGLWFDSRTTHAGSGDGPNFRLFVGSVCTPEGFSIESNNQSYFEMDQKEEFGAYRAIHDYISEDEDHSDENLYPEFFKAGPQASKLKTPRKSGFTHFYSLVSRAWAKQRNKQGI